MKLGLDFDNTLIDYDELFFEAALESGLIEAQTPVSKTAVRYAVRARFGDERWTELQIEIYGRRIGRAKPAPFFKEFARHMARRGVELFIVSHKKNPEFRGQTVDLRGPALDWMKAQDYFTPRGLNLSLENVFFEETRSLKIERIRNLKLTHFVDDLEEVLSHPEFPRDVRRILYAPVRGYAPEEGSASSWPGPALSSWKDAERFFEREIAREATGLETRFAAWTQTPGWRAEKIRSGINGESFRVRGGSGSFFAKFYTQFPQDKRNRLLTEFNAFSFLRSNGVDFVPEPFRMDEELNLGVYHWVDGDRLSAQDFKESDAERLAGMLSALQALKSQAGRAAIPTASEACFSVEDYCANLVERVRRLSHVPETELDRTLAKVLSYARAESGRLGFKTDGKLNEADRVLNPSDVGLHNIIRANANRLVLVDFEYFGWDDPAKMIADYLLQPEHAIPTHLRGEFLKRMLTVRSVSDVTFEARLGMVYPILALKWCCIMLNCFLPERADYYGNDLPRIQSERLKKAGQTVRRVLDYLEASEASGKAGLFTGVYI